MTLQFCLYLCIRFTYFAYPGCIFPGCIFPNLSCFYFFFKDLLIDFFISLTGSNQVKATSQELQVSLVVGVEPSSWVTNHYLPRKVMRGLDWKQSSWLSNTECGVGTDDGTSSTEAQLLAPV